jgi:hypothetical protein
MRPASSPSADSRIAFCSVSVSPLIVALFWEGCALELTGLKFVKDHRRHEAAVSKASIFASRSRATFNTSEFGKANASAARHRWFTKPAKPKSFSSKAAVNPRSPASLEIGRTSVRRLLP